MKIAIVVAGDANIFALSYGCLMSIQSVRARGTSVFFLDIGCTKGQLKLIRSLVDGITKFNEKLAIEPAGEKRPYWKAQGCRPFLTRYFKGHDIYIWLDSDTWVQDPNAIAEMARVAQTNGSAIAPEIAAGYRFLHQPEASHKLFSQKHEFVRHAYGDEIANAMLFMPYLNTGVFAIAANSGLFELFEDELKNVYARGYTHMAEQICLNKIMIETGKYHLVSAIYNWMCNHAEPLKNDDNIWTSPTAPFENIKIIHLCGKNKIAKYQPLGLLFDGGVYMNKISSVITKNDGYYV